MARHWGLTRSDARDAYRTARAEKPGLTTFATIVFGVIGAALAAASFAGARAAQPSLFHGLTLIVAVIAAGFGCWFYIWLARARFAAQFSGARDGFSSLLRFYAKAGLALFLAFLGGEVAGAWFSQTLSVWVLCATGGAAAAAAFQTVTAFVPYYEAQ